jgi:hypothetical protein
VVQVESIVAAVDDYLILLFLLAPVHVYYVEMFLILTLFKWGQGIQIANKRLDKLKVVFSSSTGIVIFG